MRDAVRAEALPFTERFEGSVPYMYLDVGGQATGFVPAVSVGYGFLIDPMADALPLPWVHKIDGTPATRPEVVAEWTTVKGATKFAKLGGGAIQWKALTTLVLSPAGMLSLFQQHLAGNEVELRKFFLGWDTFPANAQLAIVSMAWACGGAFAVEFPRFTKAANAGDWATCAGPDGCADTNLAARGEAWMRDGTPGQLKANENPGLRPRNLANKLLFHAAADGGDPSGIVPIYGLTS